MRQFELAEKYYNAALTYQPANSYFLGGLASFLYSYGEPRKAFNAYLELLAVDQINKDEQGIELSKTALKALGEKMGLSPDQLAERIEKICFDLMVFEDRFSLMVSILRMAQVYRQFRTGIDRHAEAL